MLAGAIARVEALWRAFLSGEAIWLRYLSASVVALIFDTSLFMLLLAGGMAPLPAAATGYCSGIAVHWLISSRAVFARHAASGSARDRQKLLFVGSAVAGLSITSGIVGTAAALGLHPLAGKAIATVVSFQLTYLLRRKFVFGA
jgi:putative flippase GtrA